MLIQFNFKNYKSFRDEVSLDLTATKITEHEDHVAEAANDKLLKVAAIYGANASGKSNVYDAFEYMTYYVDESFKFGDEEERRRKTGDSYLKVTPFLLMKTAVKKRRLLRYFMLTTQRIRERHTSTDFL